jgi:hypothetical protein
MKRYFLASTIISARPIAAFNATMPPIVPGSVAVNTAAVAAMIAMAQNSAAQLDPIAEDLSARDEASAWMLPYWELVDDIVEGFAAIKRKEAIYLPKFADENPDEYKDRLALTKFTNVYRDTIEVLASKPFEEECSIVKPKDKAGKESELPDEINEFAEDVDGSGNNLTTFAGSVFFNGINSAIDWIYVDYPTVDISIVRSKAQAKAENIRPFWSHVLGRNVLEAKTQMINGKETLVKMRILEPGSPNHIRVFDRVTDNFVMMGLFQEKLGTDGKTKTFILVKSAQITIGVIPLVPFITGRRDGRTFKIFPPMRDSADLQIELYQQESGLKFAKTMTAYPMLAANGITPEKGPDGKPKRLRVGPSRVLYSAPDGMGNAGSWGYISPSAECLKFLSEDINDTQTQLRELGRQPLTASSNNLTVITTAYAAGKAKTAVGAWAYLLKDALENAMKLTCLWLGIDETKFEPEIAVFTDFDDFATDQAADLTAIGTARTNRDLSQKNYFRELKRRGTLRAEFDVDENAAELLDETPADDGSENDGANPPKPGDPAKPPPTKPQPPKPGATS